MAYIQTKIKVTRKKDGNMKYGTFSSYLYHSHHETLFNYFITKFLLLWVSSPRFSQLFFTISQKFHYNLKSYISYKRVTENP